MNVRPVVFFTLGLGLALAVGWSGFPKWMQQTRPQPLDFNHKIHGEKGGMACDACHSFRADGSFTGIPAAASCAGCHETPMGGTDTEKRLSEEFIKKGRGIPWQVYARQPMNVRFSHIVHVQRGKLACEKCHEAHGTSTRLAAYTENRLSGYSQTMDMRDCERCHRQNGVEAGCLGCHK